MKNSMVNNKILNITPEDRQRRIDSRIERIKKTTMEYQIGCYVADEIVKRYLPCLNVDMMQTNNVINVSDEEFEEANRLRDVWYKSTTNDKNPKENPNWLALRSYHKDLENKYLPKELKCYLDPINVIDIEEFKRGLIHGLWDCDICHYNISNNSDIDVNYDDEYYFTIITLTR